MDDLKTCGEVLTVLRRERGWSQEEVARKVFVSRQAVSKWELNESTPGPESLKLLSDLFQVSINTILAVPDQNTCECCGMPLTDDILGRDSNGNPDGRYCQWCLSDGTFQYEDFDEMVNYLCQNVPAWGKAENETVEAYFRRILLELPYWKQKGSATVCESS